MRGSVRITIVLPAFHVLLKTCLSIFHDIFFMDSHFLFEIVTQLFLWVTAIQSIPSEKIQRSQQAKHILLCLDLDSTHICAFLLWQMGSYMSVVESFLPLKLKTQHKKNTKYFMVIFVFYFFKILYPDQSSGSQYFSVEVKQQVY